MRVSVIFFLGFLCLSANAHDLKIGFIDTQEIIVNLTQYKNSVDSISREFDPKKQELLDLFKHIELLRSNIDFKNTNEEELSRINFYDIKIDTCIKVVLIYLNCFTFFTNT